MPRLLAAETQSPSFLDRFVVLPYVFFAILIVEPRVALQDGPVRLDVSFSQWNES